MIPLSLGKVVEFVSDNHPYAKTWEPEVLASWVAAFVREELIICASDGGRQIDGMVMFRLVMKPEDGIGDDYHFDPEGACAFIDFGCAKTPAMLRGLIIAVIQRVGTRPLVAWERRGILRVYEGARFVRHTLKEETYHGS